MKKIEIIKETHGMAVGTKKTVPTHIADALIKNGVAKEVKTKKKDDSND